MPPALPRSRPRRARPRPAGRFTALAALLGVLAAEPCRALEVTMGGPREQAGYVYCDVRISDPLEARVRESLARGMPATLEVHAELWRRRNGWFDRLESTFDASVRIRYEVWADRYRIDRGGEPLRVSTLDSAAAVLSRPWALPVSRVGEIKPRAGYYVVVTAALRPLSVEDVREVEGWLSGEVVSKGRSGLGVITELPRSLFDAVRNFAGFGDRRARTVSPQFGLADLRAERP